MDSYKFGFLTTVFVVFSIGISFLSGANAGTQKANDVVMYGRSLGAQLHKRHQEAFTSKRGIRSAESDEHQPPAWIYDIIEQSIQSNPGIVETAEDFGDFRAGVIQGLSQSCKASAQAQKIPMKECHQLAKDTESVLDQYAADYGFSDTHQHQV